MSVRPSITARSFSFRRCDSDTKVVMLTRTLIFCSENLARMYVGPDPPVWNKFQDLQSWAKASTLNNDSSTNYRDCHVPKRYIKLHTPPNRAACFCCISGFVQSAGSCQSWLECSWRRCEQMTGRTYSRMANISCRCNLVLSLTATLPADEMQLSQHNDDQGGAEGEVEGVELDWDGHGYCIE